MQWKLVEPGRNQYTCMQGWLVRGLFEYMESPQKQEHVLVFKSFLLQKPYLYPKFFVYTKINLL